MRDTPAQPNSWEVCGAASVIYPMTILRPCLEKDALVIDEGYDVWVTVINGDR